MPSSTWAWPNPATAATAGTATAGTATAGTATTTPHTQLTELDARFGDGQSRIQALVSLTSVETDAILFEMRAAHDDIFSLAVNRQVVFSVQSRLFSDLASKLASALAASDYVVHRRVSKRAATSLAVTITDADGMEGTYEPASASADLADVVYPSASTGSVGGLIAAVPSRARGYALAGGVRTYLTGYRADAVSAAPGDDAAAAIARPWETAADELQTLATIIADTARIAGVAHCAYHAVADVPKVWVVAQLVYNGWQIPPFVAGKCRESYSRNIKAAYAGGPSLRLVITPTGRAELHVTSSSTPPIILTQRDDQYAQWTANQVSKPSATAVGVIDRAAIQWSVQDSVQFKASLVPAEQLQACGNYVKNSTLDAVVIDDTGDYMLEWTYESGTYQGKRTVRTDGVGTAMTTKYATFTEAAVPRLVRLAASGGVEPRRQLRDELASATPFTSTLETAKDVDNYNKFVDDVKKEIESKLKCTEDGTLNPFVLHACHNPTSGASSGRDDVPVIRMGVDGLWCTGQHALAATTGMLLASNYACA